MLIRLESNHESFRPVVFKRNRLNIILATKSKSGDRKGSRNGLGKSCLVSILCYCLGMNVDMENEIPRADLPGWSFTLTFEVRKRLIVVTRGLDDIDDIVVTGDLSGYPNLPQPELDVANGYKLKERDWRHLVCWLFFGLLPTDFLDGNESAKPPEYQSLISHFLRRYFDDPVRVNRTEANVRAEMAITFLLGLDWQYLASAKELRARDKEAQLKIDGANSRLKEWQSKRELLKQECRLLASKIDEAERALAQYNTIPHAQLVEESVEQLTKEINRLDRKMSRNRNLLKSAQNSQVVRYVSFDPVVRFYDELGSAFTEGAKHTLKQVKAFHDNLTVNRSGFLDAQISSLTKALADDQVKLDDLIARRQKSVDATNANSAFEDYRRRSKDLEEKKSELAVKKDCLDRLSKGEEELAVIAQERQRLVAQAREVHEKLRPIWETEDRYFADLISSLYGIKGATLGIAIKGRDSECGMSYKPTFQTDRSLGKKKMKAFAFDLTIFDHQKTGESGVDFMVHDSVLYESSDSRQYARALKIVAELCERKQLQYIGVINSDDMETDDFKKILPKEEVDKYVVHKLTDEPSGKGALFGFFFPVVEETGDVHQGTMGAG